MSHLVGHSRTHSGEKPYKCDFEGCRYATADTGALVNHKRTHSGEKPFKCEFDGCVYAAASSSALTAHRRTHSGERPFKCNFDGCEYAATQSSHLVTHKRTHTGNLPYKCDFAGCYYAAAQSNTLSAHRRTHSGEKPHKCNFDGCEFAATQSCNLIQHKFIHHTREGQVRMKLEESRILRVLTKANVDFTEQHMIDFCCMGEDRDGARAWIDFLVQVKDENNKVQGIIFLEVDEEQHKTYNVTCEVRRMSDVHRTLILEGNTLPVCFIRYNPDSYSVDGKNCKVTKTKREEDLVERLTSFRFTKDFEVLYLHYDTTNGSLALLSDPEYDVTFKLCVTNM